MAPGIVASRSTTTTTGARPAALNAESVALLRADARVDPTAENDHAIESASCYGYSEVVRLLRAHLSQ